MEKINIGINERIPLTVLEMALQATLNGDASPEYFCQLLQAEGKGENRAKKSVVQINRATVKNRLLPMMMENKETVINSLKSRFDKPLIIAALLSSAYSIVYDSMSLMGKYFHAQPQINSTFLKSKLGEKYGANRSLFVAVGAFIPMLEEAGLITRPKIGVYEIVRQSKYSDFALSVYKEAFKLYNPFLSTNSDIESHPFFEFIKQ